MIQFLNKWLDPTHVLTVSKPFYDRGIQPPHLCVQVRFMFLNNPVEFFKKLDDRIKYTHILGEKWYDALRADYQLQAEEFERSEEYTTFLKIINQVKEKL